MRPVRKANNLTSFMCILSWNLGALTFWNPQDLYRYCFTFTFTFTLFCCRTLYMEPQLVTVEGVRLADNIPSVIKKIPHLMKTEGSLNCSQEFNTHQLNPVYTHLILLLRLLLLNL